MHSFVILCKVPFKRKRRRRRRRRRRVKIILKEDYNKKKNLELTTTMELKHNKYNLMPVQRFSGGKNKEKKEEEEEQGNERMKVEGRRWIRPQRCSLPVQFL